MTQSPLKRKWLLQRRLHAHVPFRITCKVLGALRANVYSTLRRWTDVYYVHRGNKSSEKWSQFIYESEPPTSFINTNESAALPSMAGSDLAAAAAANQGADGADAALQGLRGPRPAGDPPAVGSAVQTKTPRPERQTLCRHLLRSSGVWGADPNLPTSPCETRTLWSAHIGSKSILLEHFVMTSFTVLRPIWIIVIVLLFMWCISQMVLILLASSFRLL